MSYRRRARMPQERRSKYRAVPVVVDGVRFASKAEARRYGQLKLMEKAGSIRSLLVQPRYGLYVRPFVRENVAPGELLKCGDYVGDFQYEELTETGGRWDLVVEDVKGMKTPVYRLKKKIVEALYGFEIREIR